MAELIAYVKANPGKLSFGSSGHGTSSHLAGELFKVMTGSAMQHVPYRGTGPAMIDLIAGQVQIYFTSTVGILQHIQEGKVRALAVTGAKRFEALPELPAVAETVPGFEVLTWLGVGAPKATPGTIVDLLNREINAGFGRSEDQDAAVRDRRHGGHRDAGAAFGPHRRRDRTVDQGGEGCRDQGRLSG